MYKKESSIGNPNWGESNLWNWADFHCHWRVLGEENKKPLVLIHGFGASSAHWRFNAQYFAQQGFRVYALDLIGFGKSEQPVKEKIKKLNNRFWAIQLGSFLEEVVDTKEKGKAVLLGNSLGALVALTTSVIYPNLVEAVIAAPLADPSLIRSSKIKLPYWLLIFKRFLIKTFFTLLPLEIIIPLIIKTKLINIALQSAYYHSVRKDLDLKRIVISPAQRNSSARALRSMCIGMALRKESDTARFLLDRLNTRTNHLPMLLVWGRQDRFVPLSIGEMISTEYPWIKLMILEKSGHCPHDESSCDFNHYVLHWLKNKLRGHIQKT